MGEISAALALPAASLSHTAFYVAAGLLALWAMIVSAIGISRRGFPPSLGGERGVIAISAVLVVAAIGTAVLSATYPEESIPRAKVDLGVAPPVGQPSAPSAGGGQGAGAPAGGGGGAQAASRQLFTQHCGTCHTLAAAGTSGTSGPDLDQLKPASAIVVKQVTNGGAVMPAFKGQLTPAQIKALASYVAGQAGK